MKTTITCSWCHAPNPTTVDYCHECGHRVAVARMDCDCDQCRRPTQYLELGDKLIPISEYGLGAENPDTSDQCTRNPRTCEMIVLANGTTKSRMKYNNGQLCDWPHGTCMLAPRVVGICKYL